MRPCTCSDNGLRRERKDISRHVAPGLSNSSEHNHFLSSRTERKEPEVFAGFFHAFYRVLILLIPLSSRRMKNSVSPAGIFPNPWLPSKVQAFSRTRNIFSIIVSRHGLSVLSRRNAPLPRHSITPLKLENTNPTLPFSSL